MQKVGTKLLLSLAACVAVGWLVWVISGHERRAISRLQATGIVAANAQVTLIHSTGYFREATHYFVVATSAVELNKQGGPVLDNIDHESVEYRECVESVPKLIREAVPSFDFGHAKLYIGEGLGLLSEINVIATDERSLIVLKVF